VNQVPLRGLFFLAAYAIIFPKVPAFGIGLGLDDILALLLFPCLMFHVLVNSGRKYVWEFWLVVLLFLAFIGIYFFLGSWKNYQRLGVVRYPTELWQYAKRLSFFLLGFFFVLNVERGESKAIKTVLWAYFLILMIGVLQLVAGSIGEFLAQLYGRSEHQVERLVDRTFSAKRVFGTAGHPNAWGGFSLFVFSVVAPFFLDGRAFSRRTRLLLGILVGFALINVLFSSSRAAILGLGMVSLSLSVWYLFTSRVREPTKALLISASMLSVFIFFISFKERIFNLIFRFSVLFETMGGGRDEQIRAGLSVHHGMFDSLIGSSNYVQRVLGVSHGVEVEPVYLFINYGFLGVSFIFLIMASIFYCGMRLAFSGHYYAPIGLGVMLAIVGYSTFSLGYFFFQELVVGTPFWLYAGIFMACYQRSLSHR